MTTGARTRARAVATCATLGGCSAPWPPCRASGTFPSAASFALLELDRPASELSTRLLARHGVYVRDCADKRGLHGDRCLRVAARTRAENRRILAALADVLAAPAAAEEMRDGRPVAV